MTINTNVKVNKNTEIWNSYENWLKKNQGDDFFCIDDDNKKIYAFIIKQLLSSGYETFTANDDKDILKDCIFEDKTFCFWKESNEYNSITISIIKLIDNNDFNNYREWLEYIDSQKKLQEENKSSVFGNLINAIKEDVNEDLDDESKIKFNLLMIYDEKDISKTDRKEIDEITEKSKWNVPIWKTYKEVANTKDDEDMYYIKEATLFVDEKDNFLKYNSCNTSGIKKEAFICNIEAKSLYDIYNKYNNYKNNPLLGLNLRYHIKNKKVDDAIKNSIKDDPKDFWLKNNGLVILCSEYKIDDKKVQLYNLSIINGGQTTFNIANSDPNDLKNVYIQTKIIKIDDFTKIDNNEIIIDFVNEIANCTNNQKKITDEDLNSNSSETRQIKIKLGQGLPKIQLKNKRGEKPDNEIKKLNLMTSITQILLIWNSFNEFLPGTAKSGKSKLFKKERFEKCFKSAIKNIDYLKELIFLDNTYIMFKNKKELQKMKNENFDDNIIEFVKLCHWYFISIIKIIFICHEYLTISNDSNFCDQLINDLNKDYQNQSYSEIINKINCEFERIKPDRLLKLDIKGKDNKSMKQILKSLKDSIWDFFKSDLCIRLSIQLLISSLRDDQTLTNCSKMERWFQKFLYYFILNYKLSSSEQSKNFSKIFNLRHDE